MSTTTNPAPSQPQPLVHLEGEYRFARVDGMTFPARDGKPARTVKRAIHTLEVDARSLELTEVLPETTDLATWKTPHAKGSKVRVALDFEPAKVLTVQNGKAQESKGLWRVRVLSIVAMK